jgi:hypothetical protein
MFQKSPEKGSPEASRKLLQSGEKEIAAAETNYKATVLKHGESSNEAVKAKTEWNEAKNKYSANQTHVQQLQAIDAAPAPAVNPMSPTSGNMYPQQ